ncbi:hypothetical protein BJ138DRAFT_1161921 [Hygrophoropsis aurantiaca]|uniref:Uncharacterized protein n=1 Tax=Hygrophoropsis aurantiaca TaxID=72124 RepID=A0ACB7ZZP2_9AGAM|nr:hypothetical protein BJ138DRAFT_1161921 [Hygrophoropsis aurantiaca]
MNVELTDSNRLKMSRLPAYEQVLRLGRDDSTAILLDIGCCFGNDLREAVKDGFPVKNIIGSDLHPELWNLGHELFKSTPESFPAHFVPGDAFDPSILSATPISSEPTEAAVPDLATLKSLNPLQGHISAIHASAFFHLFDEEKQLHMARALAGLLSPKSGSVIFGLHTGSDKKGKVSQTYMGTQLNMFCHDLKSWTALWDGQVFVKGTVNVDARLMDVAGYRLLVWSVTRV